MSKTPIETAADAVQEAFPLAESPRHWVEEAFGSLVQHRDDIAQVMNQQDGAYQGRISPSWEGLSEAGKAFYRSQVDVVLAYLTGEAS